MIGPITYTYEELLAHKAAGVPDAALERLRRDADAILEKPTVDVTKIKLPRPSGNIHDYVSIGIYWWPNPDTPDGLPWVNRDGVRNPDTRSGNEPSVVHIRVHTLALAAFYFPDRAGEYAEYANRQIYDWYINPETYMTPHALYAQSIPGICEGRSAGLIDFSTVSLMIDGVGIFECLGLIEPEILAGTKEWFAKFTDWILTSEYGISLNMGYDNHASWRDANVLSRAVFNDREALKKNIAITAYDLRVKGLVDERGAQPAELRRTKAIGYSCYNLEAMLTIAKLAERAGITKYWEADAERGECILKKAVDFLYPYVKDPKNCPYPDLYQDSYGSRMARMMLIMDRRFSGEGYAERAEEFIKGNESWLLEPIM